MAEAGCITVTIAASPGHVADQKVTDIETRWSTLTVHQKLGVTRPEIAAAARSLVVEHWLVLYKVDAEGIETKNRWRAASF